MSKEKAEDKIQCDFCKKKKDSVFFSLSKLLIMTDKRVFETGLLSLVKDLNKYTIKKCIHLSGSEIILLRPDILVDFLQRHYKEAIVSYSFKSYKICSDCFEKYKPLVPER